MKQPVERGNYVKFKMGKYWINGLIDTWSVSTIINLALAAKIIEPSQSVEFNARVSLVGKKDGSHRMVVDL